MDPRELEEEIRIEKEFFFPRPPLHILCVLPGTAPRLLALSRSLLYASSFRFGRPPYHKKSPLTDSLTYVSPQVRRTTRRTLSSNTYVVPLGTREYRLVSFTNPYQTLRSTPLRTADTSPRLRALSRYLLVYASSFRSAPHLLPCNCVLPGKLVPMWRYV